jgi:hypothetical protein
LNYTDPFTNDDRSVVVIKQAMGKPAHSAIAGEFIIAIVKEHRTPAKRTSVTSGNAADKKKATELVKLMKKGLSYAAALEKYNGGSQEAEVSDDFPKPVDF